MPWLDRGRSTLALLMLVGAQMSCFAPSVPEGLSCSGSQICPSGQVCDPRDSICRDERGDGSDAGLDGRGAVSDGAAGDGAVDDGFCADDDIVLCMRFENRATDDSTRMLAVTEVSPISYDVDGARGSAAVFDGDGMLQIDDMIGADPHTIEMWVRLSNNQTGALAAVQGAYQVRQIQGNVIEWNNGLFGIVRSQAIDTDWNHLTIVVGTNGVTMFVNGAAGVSVPFVSNSGVPNMSIGSRFGETPWVGQLDQLRIWNRALSAAEVAAIAEAP